MTSNTLKQIYQKAKETLSGQVPNRPESDSPIAPSQHPRTISPPTATDVLRFRFQHGVNLGSVFVLERWLSPQMFAEGCTGNSELDAVSRYVASPSPLPLSSILPRP